MFIGGGYTLACQFHFERHNFIWKIGSSLFRHTIWKIKTYHCIVVYQSDSKQIVIPKCQIGRMNMERLEIGSRRRPLLVPSQHLEYQDEPTALFYTKIRFQTECHFNTPNGMKNIERLKFPFSRSIFQWIRVVFSIVLMEGSCVSTLICQGR